MTFAEGIIFSKFTAMCYEATYRTVKYNALILWTWGC